MGKYKVAKAEAEAVSIKFHKTFLKKNLSPIYLFFLRRVSFVSLPLHVKSNLISSTTK